MNLDTLNVKIQADNTDIKKKLGELKAQLEQTKQKIRDFKQTLSDWDSIGVDRMSLAYQDLTNKIADAEKEQQQLTKELEEYIDTADDAAASTNGGGNSFGSSITKAAGRMFSFVKIIQEAKQAIEDYTNTNPESPITKSIEEAKQSWAELKTDLIDELQPLIITIADAVKMINQSLKPTNEMIGGIVKLLKDSGILDLLTTVVQLATVVGNLPINLINMGFEDLYGKTSKVHINLEQINTDFKDLTKYYKLITKEIKESKHLLGGFDELNIFAKKEDVDNQAEINELQEYLNELKEDERKIQEQIYSIYKEYADELGITVEDYKRLAQAFTSGDIEKAKQIADDLGINWNTAKNNLEAFVTDGLPKINQLTTEVTRLKLEIEEVVKLLNALGSKATTYNAPRKTGNPDKSPEQGGTNYRGKDYNPYLNSNNPILRYYTPSGNDFPGMYAEGGVFTSPTLGIVGEYAGATHNPEIIAPQDMIFETVQQANGMLVDVVAQAAAQVVAAINNQNLEVSIGDDVIASSAARGNKAYYNMTGGYLI